jgi:hypothetical protein
MLGLLKRLPASLCACVRLKRRPWNYLTCRSRFSPRIAAHTKKYNNNKKIAPKDLTRLDIKST